MKWITREHPKIDRLACPWLIRKFIDPQAEFIYVPFIDVYTKAEKLKAIPFDVPEVEYTHYEDQCTFDYFVKKHGITDPAIKILAAIVRGADTDRHDLAGECAGLWAVSAGLSYNFRDDHELLKKGMMIYDALYSWAKFMHHETHTGNTQEKLLLDIFTRFIERQKQGSRKIPGWAKELKEIIQDKIDTDFSLSLKEISKELDVHPAYLSRAFSKYFDNISFGDYIRSRRIEKAIELLRTDYPLSQVAYLTGFSDQSHFTRIFKKHTGKKPSSYRKSLIKSKRNTKS